MKSKVKFTPFNPVDYLTSEEAIQAYLEETRRIGDKYAVAKAEGHAAEARERITKTGG